MTSLTDPTTGTTAALKLATDAVNAVSAIATLPEVTQQIIQTVEDPRSSAHTLHKIVGHDPALVSRILKVVNSSFYGLPGQVASVDRAIVMLGLNAVKNIAVAASLGQMFRGNKLCKGFAAKDLWTHCVAVAVTSREIAKQLRLPIADEAFLAGMIHDLGLLVTLQTWPEKLAAVCDAVPGSGRSFVEVEREIIGVDHQTIGSVLTEKWKFPRTCQQVAAAHHNPSILAQGTRTVTAIVHAADVVACQQKQGLSLTCESQTIDAESVEQAGVPMQIVQDVASRLPALIADASTLAAA